jgi:hypothetical protein
MGEAEVEVLRASPVNTTGVQTLDLIGCPQNDNARHLNDKRTSCGSETSGTGELVRTE